MKSVKNVNGIQIIEQEEKYPYLERLFGLTPPIIYDACVISMGFNRYKVKYWYKKQRVNKYSHHIGFAEDRDGEPVIYDVAIDAINVAIDLLKQHGVRK